MTEEEVQWLAMSRLREGKRRLRTFLDENFGADWGPPARRRIEDSGQLVLQQNVSYKLQRGASGALGAGMFTVKVGEKQFRCLRVLDVQEGPSEERELFEAHVTRSGRTVLARRYNGRRWKTGEGKPP